MCRGCKPTRHDQWLVSSGDVDAQRPVMNKLALSTRFDVLRFLFKQDSLMLRMWFLPCIFSHVENMVGSKKLQVYEVRLHATFGWIDTRKISPQTFYMYHTIQRYASIQQG